MAQFDVYKNSSQVTSTRHPLLVDVQHSVLSALTTRLVIPLGEMDAVDVIAMDVLMPTVRFSGQQYALLTPQMAAVRVRFLSGPIGTLEHSRSEVLAALDFAISGN